jgi:hypothetical protein
MSIKEEAGAKELRVALPVIHPKPPKIEVIKRCEKPTRPPHPSKVVKAEKTPWDTGVKLTVQRKYLCDGDYEIHEYNRLLLKEQVQPYEELIRKFKETAKREPKIVETIHICLLSTRQSLTPTLISIITGLPKDQVQYTLYSHKELFRAVPSAYLPPILDESQYVPKRYVEPEYQINEILKKPIPPDAVIEVPFPFPKPKKEYATLEDFLKPPEIKPPPPEVKPFIPPPIEAPALPFAATRPPYVVHFPDSGPMHIEWNLPSKWKCLIGNHEFISWYPPQCPKHPEAKYDKDIQYLHVVTPKELKSEVSVIHPMVIPSLKYLPVVM